MNAVEILLVSGLHANETCAPILAEVVARRLDRLGVGVELVHLPRSVTLLGFLDDPDSAMTSYSRPAGLYLLDMDLDGLDGELRRRYPGALIFELHNAEDTSRILTIDPSKPIEDYEVGTVGPHFVRPYEVGTWRNVDRDGRPAKYLIELPASYVDVDGDLLAWRRLHLGRLSAEGYGFEAHHSPYLERVTDIEASRRKGYLDDRLAWKVADWIIGQRTAAVGRTRV